MSLEVVLNFPTPSTTAVAALQTPASAGNLVLVTAVGNYPVPPVVFPGIQMSVTITSGMDATLAAYTITGENIYGVITTEQLAGPDTATATSVNQYHKIYSIAGNDAADGIAVSAGYTNPSTSMWVNGDHFRPMAQTSIRALVTGSITYSVVQTLDDPIILPTTADTFSLDFPATTWINATATKLYYLPSPFGGIQASVSSTTAGSVRIGVLQQGVRA